jgi:hypothetical protein
MEDIIKFKAFDLKHKEIYNVFSLNLDPANPNNSFLSIIGNNTQEESRDDKSCVLLQYINKKDKQGNEIYVNDILKILVKRRNYEGYHNLNHGNFYLNCCVKNVRGDLVYNKNEIEKLKEAKGKELYNQGVCYDTNIFDANTCQYFIRDNIGNIIQETKNGCTNPKRGFDYEVIGNILTTPELFNE